MHLHLNPFGLLAVKKSSQIICQSLFISLNYKRINGISTTPSLNSDRTGDKFSLAFTVSCQLVEEDGVGPNTVLQFKGTAELQIRRRFAGNRHCI